MRRMRRHRGVRGAADRGAAGQGGPKARLSPALAQARALRDLPQVPDEASGGELDSPDGSPGWGSISASRRVIEASHRASGRSQKLGHVREGVAITTSQAGPFGATITLVREGSRLSRGWGSPTAFVL